MTSVNLVKRIKKYSIISFLLPLIAINSCFFIYKYIGNITHGPKSIQIYANLNWDKTEHTYSLKEYDQITNDHKTRTYTNCPKYQFMQDWYTVDDKVIPNIPENSTLIKNLFIEKKIKSVTFKHGKNLNYSCINNYKEKYLLIKKFVWLEKLLIHAQKNPVGFSVIKNPYLYGEVSISRTARYFPAIVIFKTLIIFSALMLFFYWKNNLNFFKELNSKKIIANFSKKFFYFGFLSCIFLILHAAFLGLNLDSIIFTKIRRLIIILFILFEILAQFFLTVNFLKFRDRLKNYINLLILKIKIIFLFIVFLTTFVAFFILAFGDSTSAFKHILEWNYFVFLLIYYLLSRLIWK